ncbi:MAG TPA: hypothetical protein VFP65_29610 [Anaeromyxobacteraceae bacterium]|nr:hypothetical protein [Anaeromyxobacteraceae bacterium]
MEAFRDLHLERTLGPGGARQGPFAHVGLGLAVAKQRRERGGGRRIDLERRRGERGRPRLAGVRCRRIERARRFHRTHRDTAV